MDATLSSSVKRNFIVGFTDGTFFGFALGFASFVTILPLFVSHLTDSALLIGLIPAIRGVGWQLPQLLTVGHISRLERYKPMVMRMTILERAPFLGLAGVAWFLPQLDKQLALSLTFLLLILQGLGGGVAAAPWQNMIGKVIPPNRLGTFFGGQAAVATLASAIGVVAAGMILQGWPEPLNYTACFLLACAGMALSWAALSQTVESPAPPAASSREGQASWVSLTGILRRDANFRWFLVVRMLGQFATMAFAFYVIYAVRQYHMNAAVAGVMTGVFNATQIAANPLLGWLADRLGPRLVLQVGMLAAVGSALLAWLAPALEWFYVVFVLAGVANVVIWTLAISITLTFSRESERPAYIGLANTLIAPATILAPLFGGWLADTWGFAATFLVSAGGGLVTTLLVQRTISDPRLILQPAASLAAQE